MKKDAYISIRVSEEVKQELENIARDSDRSLARQIMFILKQSLPQIAKLNQKQHTVGSKDPKNVGLHPDLS